MDCTTSWRESQVDFFSSLTDSLRNWIALFIKFYSLVSNLAGAEGLEPSVPVLETGGLPVNRRSHKNLRKLFLLYGWYSFRRLCRIFWVPICILSFYRALYNSFYFCIRCKSARSSFFQLPSLISLVIRLFSLRGGTRPPRVRELNNFTTITQ